MLYHIFYLKKKRGSIGRMSKGRVTEIKKKTTSVNKQYRDNPVAGVRTANIGRCRSLSSAIGRR